jgi:hypothetical protein
MQPLADLTLILRRTTDFPELHTTEQPLTQPGVVQANPVLVETIHHVNAK